MASDAELVRDVCRGDREAFGTLISRYERSLLALAFGELRDLHAAEDVAQAALLLAFEKLATLKDASRFGPWLMQIARTQVIEFVRRRRELVGVPADSSSAELDAEPDPEWIEHEHLLSLVARLSEHEQVLVGLRYFDGLSMDEISNATGSPIGSVTKQLSRAIARLRAWCQEESPK
ncbi:MAG: RNA polymerase sigma-70 factor ECF subfamily [Planctomycetota bacterium]|nr:MAG: RNA polymerase sigma-70 factor ECF subfamily [Planctomycetota bacterium]